MSPVTIQRPSRRSRESVTFRSDTWPANDRTCAWIVTCLASAARVDPNDIEFLNDPVSLRVARHSRESGEHCRVVHTARLKEIQQKLTFRRGPDTRRGEQRIQETAVARRLKPARYQPACYRPHPFPQGGQWTRRGRHPRCRSGARPGLTGRSCECLSPPCGESCPAG